MSLLPRPAAPGDRLTWRRNAPAVAVIAKAAALEVAVPVDHVQSQVDAERARGISTALELLRQGRPGLARYHLTRSVMRQHRIATGQTIDIHPTCACGGRCPHGASTGGVQ